MGLIKAAMGAAGGVMADQWKEFFYCDSMDKDVMVKKGQKRVSGRLLKFVQNRDSLPLILLQSHLFLPVVLDQVSKQPSQPSENDLPMAEIPEKIREYIISIQKS